MDHVQLSTVQLITVWILPVLFAITVHEVAHGYIAYLLGDKTAQMLGRLTLNPIKHIDLIGTIIVPIVLLTLGGIIIGWAKPVPINSRNLRNPRRDMALIALAGPSSNFIMALIWGGIAKGASLLIVMNFPGALALYVMGGAGISINLMLMIINLLPIPQLDGGHIMSAILPQSLSVQYDRLAPYGFFILLGLFAIGALGYVLQPVIGFLFEIIVTIFNLPM